MSLKPSSWLLARILLVGSLLVPSNSAFAGECDAYFNLWQSLQNSVNNGDISRFRDAESAKSIYDSCKLRTQTSSGSTGPLTDGETGKTIQSCDYNGKFYANCEDARRQYQIDLDNYNKQQAASIPPSTSTSEPNSNSNTNSGKDSTPVTNGGQGSCPGKGSGSPDSPSIQLIRSKDGKISAKVLSDTSSGTKKATEFVVDFRKISASDKELAMKSNAYMVEKKIFEKSVVISKGSFSSDKDHIFALEGIVQGTIEAKNRCGSNYAYITTQNFYVYDWSKKEWSQSILDKGPYRYQILNNGICPTANKDYKNAKVTLDVDENGPIYRIRFDSSPPRGTTVSVALGYRNSSNITSFSNMLISNGEAVDQDLRIPQDSQYIDFHTVTYFESPCGDVSIEIVGGTFKVMTKIAGVTSTLTTAELQRLCQTNKVMAKSALTNFETLLQAYQSGVSQFAFYSKYVTWLDSIKTKNAPEYLDLQGDCPNKINIETFNTSIDRVRDSIKQDIKVEAERTRLEALQVEAKAKADAEAKAKADAEAKAKADAEAKAKADAKAKISRTISITCVKGKDSLRVSGKKPLCPSGYKKK